MDLEKLTNSQGYYYRARLLAIMKSKRYEGLGIMYNAVEMLPELDRKLVSNPGGEVDISDEEIQELSQQYDLLSKEFDERYLMFYKRCVRDIVARDYLHDAFADSKDFVSSFLGSRREDFEEVYNQTDGKDAIVSLEIFKQIIPLNKGLDLKAWMEKCIDKAYS